MISGIINVYKEKGYTSHDVVAKLRGIFRQKKIGHTGTLDPDAEGVLPVCLGKATRACDLLAEKDKVYEAVLLLGISTDTQDIGGKVQKELEVACTEEEIREAAGRFVGSYQQVPPMYSALKVNGRKLCDLARAGVEVERKPREVTVFSIQIGEIALPRVRMRVHCSKGTYIRTLCHDIGQALGCGGCMESLLRTRVAMFGLQDAYRISEIEERVRQAREKASQEHRAGEEAGKEAPQEHRAGKGIQKQASQGREDGKGLQEGLSKECLGGMVMDTDSVFLQYPKLLVKPEFSKPLYNGNALPLEGLEGWEAGYRELILRVYDSSHAFVGIYRWEEEIQKVKPVKIFAEGASGV